MSNERIDPETLASFLEGTLPPAERARVMRVLAESPDAYAQLVETAAVARELTPVVPIASKRRAAWYIAPSLIAAGLIGILVAPRLKNEAAPNVIALAQDTRLVQSGSGGIAARLGATWDQPAWSVVRGGGADLGERARAFRAGVRYAELEVAANASDSASAVRAAESLAEVAGTLDAGAPVAGQFRALVGSSAFGGRLARARAAEQLRSLLNAPGWFDAGAWTETARLAVAANQFAFFAPGGKSIGELKAVIRVLESSPSQQVESSRLVDALRPLLDGRPRSAADRDSLTTILEAAMTAGAR